MAHFIHVDCSKFNKTAEKIETYIENHEKNMKLATQEVKALSSTWQGKDAIEFQNQWNEVTEKKSTSQEMIQALENYAEFLRYAGNQYKDAQAKAVNRANRI
mgnify:CR=1 FL=1